MKSSAAGGGGSERRKTSAFSTASDRASTFRGGRERSQPGRQKSPRGMISHDVLSRCSRLGNAKSSRLVELPPIPAFHCSAGVRAQHQRAEARPAKTAGCGVSRAASSAEISSRDDFARRASTLQSSWECEILQARRTSADPGSPPRNRLPVRPATRAGRARRGSRCRTRSPGRPRSAVGGSSPPPPSRGRRPRRSGTGERGRRRSARGRSSSGARCR